MKYEVRVKFRKDFIEVKDNKITMGVLARPENGRANKEIVRKLSKRFDVAQASVRIISGTKSTKKIVEIT